MLQFVSDTRCCLVGAGTEAFCSGGDQSVRGKGGYVGADGVPRLNVLDLQVGSPPCTHVLLVDDACIHAAQVLMFLDRQIHGSLPVHM